MQLVRRISAAAPQPGVMIRDPSLATGNAGLAVLFAYLDRAGEGRWCGDRALSYVAEALETPVTALSLFRGAPGVAWAATHLGDRSQAAASVIERVDRALQDAVSGSPWQGLSDGLVGCGIYLLERLPDGAAVKCLEQVIDRLAELPEHLRVLAPGASGVIGLLGCAAARGVVEAKSRSLLKGAVPWLETQPLDGDPGVAAALLVAARATRDAGLERQGLTIARRAAMRPPFDYGVTESGFFHGSAGLAHQFNRMYQSTGDEELRLAARFWVEQTLAMGMPDEPGLLRGAAGVALSLLAAATDVEPAWDRLFLLSFQE